MQIKHAFMTIGLSILPFTAAAEGLIAVELLHNNIPLKLIVDDHKTVQVQGLPSGINVHFNSQSGTLFSNLDGENITYTATYGVYGKKLPTAKPEAGEEWQPYEGVPSRYWRIHVNGKTCTHAYANLRAATKAKLDYTDLSRLLAGLSYLIGPPTEGQECGPYLISRAYGKIMGLPLYTVGQDNKNSEITEIVGHEGDYNRLYTENTKALDPEAHARFLKKMLTAEETGAFEAASANLPWRQQVKGLKNLLRVKRTYLKTMPKAAPSNSLPSAPWQ